MEEIRGTETLEREILDDARKRADRILRKAEDDAKSLQTQAEQKLKEALDALAEEYRQKQKRAEQETLSRLPLEKMRLDIEYRDAHLREETQRAVAALSPEELGQWCAARLSRQAELIKDASVTVLVRGLGSESIKKIKMLFSKGSPSEVVEDSSMKARGLVVKPADDSYHISITETELIDWLLDVKRGELATALLGNSK